jgi:teichuronic acid exporter
MSSLGIRNGVFWSILGQFGYLGVTLIANIVLARILSPSEFGQLGIVLFFIVIARVFTESGLSGALVRNNKANDIDYSTIFIFNLGVSVTLCFLLIGSSGYIANFYEDQALKQLIIAASFILVINAFQFVQSVKLVKQMRFKHKSIYEFLAILIGATVGILLAINDFGVWSLIVMQLLSALVLTVICWVFEGRNGVLVFNKESFKTHYKYGVNTSLASILNSVFDNIYQVIIAKYFSIVQTGLYYQAKKLQDIPIGVINKLTQSVLFSGLSKIQEDNERFKETYQRAIRLLTVIVGFICLFLFVFAQDLVLLLLGDQWVEGTFFLQILSVVGFFYILEMFNRILFKIYNDTRYILRLEVVKKGIQLTTIFIGLYANSLNALMYGFVASSVISYLINFFFVQKKYPFIGRTNLYLVTKVFLIILLIIHITSFKVLEPIVHFRLIRILVTITLYVLGSYFIGLINFREDLKILKRPL